MPCAVACGCNRAERSAREREHDPAGGGSPRRLFVFQLASLRLLLPVSVHVVMKLCCTTYQARYWRRGIQYIGKKKKKEREKAS